jgi:hypothetical protein
VQSDSSQVLHMSGMPVWNVDRCHRGSISPKNPQMPYNLLLSKPVASWKLSSTTHSFCDFSVRPSGDNDLQSRWLSPPLLRCGRSTCQGAWALEPINWSKGKGHGAIRTCTTKVKGICKEWVAQHLPRIGGDYQNSSGARLCLSSLTWGTLHHVQAVM